MNQFTTGIFDFFLPRVCPACNNKLLPDEVSVCANCFSGIQMAEDIRISAEYNRKFESKGIISGFTSLFVFEKDKELQHVIHSVKYNKRFLNGIFLGKIIGSHLSSKFYEWNINLILPVPLHPLKKAERGYNQSFYIAKGLSRNTEIPVKDNALKRIKYTESQTTMNLTERAENMRSAFKVKRKELIKDKNILLIDDVITTGATISECGRVLLDAGAKKIFAASVAIAD